MSASSWILAQYECSNCGYGIVVTQATLVYCDYWYYCSNPDCQNHHPGVQLGDQEECEFAIKVRPNEPRP